MSPAKRRTALISLSVATFAYLIAVTQRSNIGVAALEASERFEVSATQLASLGVAQLVVYAMMQVPVGVLLDRYGSKTMLVVGSLVMGLGQLLVAVTTTFEVAATGRMLVGFGDAFIFISLTRTVNAWYQGTTASVVQQVVANVGQLGQVLSAIPFHLLLGRLGWSTAFTLAATASMVAAFLAIALLKKYELNPQPISLSSIRGLIGSNLRDPATRAAFWVHFTLQSTGSSFVLLWGYPYLVSAQQIEPALATGVLTAFVFIGFFAGPIISALGSKSILRKFRLTVSIAILIIAGWALLLFTPSPHAFWLILVFVLIVGIGGPASMMAFDYSRKLIPASRMGTANGIINTGGFIAAFTLMLIVGFLLDIAKQLGWSAGTYSNEGFQLAFVSQPLIVCLGLYFFIFESRKLARNHDNSDA